MKELNKKQWEKAGKHLEEAVESYSSIPTGIFALSWINPLKQRFDDGERTPELYREIWEIQL